MKESTIAELAERYEKVTYLINKRITHKVKDVVPTGITTEQIWILRYLKSNPNITTTELSERIQVEKSSITSLTNRLVSKGLMERRQSQTDRRVVYLNLTEEGIKLHQHIEEVIFRALLPSIEKIGEEKAFQYVEILECVAELFNDELE